MCFCLFLSVCFSFSTGCVARNNWFYSIALIILRGHLYSGDLYPCPPVIYVHGWWYGRDAIVGVWHAANCDPYKQWNWFVKQSRNRPQCLLSCKLPFFSSDRNRTSGLPRTNYAVLSHVKLAFQFLFYYSVVLIAPVKPHCNKIINRHVCL